MVECQDFLGLRRLQAQGIPKNLLDLNEPPSGCLLFKQGFQFSQGLIPFAPAPARAGGILESKKLAEIVLLPGAHPFSGRFLAMIVGVFIVKGTVQAAVKVTPAMRTNLLPAHSALKLDLFCAGVTDPHGRIIHPNRKERNILKFGEI